MTDLTSDPDETTTDETELVDDDDLDVEPVPAPSHKKRSVQAGPTARARAARRA